MSPSVPPAKLIPHSGSMVLVESVEHHEDPTTRCRCVPLHQSPLTRAGQPVSAALCLELMSQCAALQAGLRHVESGRAGEPDMVGFLVSCRRMILHATTLDPDDGSVAEVTRVGEIDGGLTAFEGKVWQQEELIAEAEFSVFRQRQPRDE